MTRRLLNLSLLGVCLLTLTTPVWTAETIPDNSGDEANVVVTATRTSTPIDQVASSVTVITTAQIAATHAPYLVDVLREVPGLMLTQTSGPGHEVDAYLRGGGIRDTLVLLDGIPLNNPITGSSYDLANLTTDNIARIEILRGSQSTLYGSNAVAGVINIITKHGSGKPTTEVTLSGGRYDTGECKISSSGGGNGWNYAFAGSRFATDGFPSAAGGGTPAGSTNNTVSTRVERKFSEAFSLDILGRYVKAKSELAGWENNTAVDDPGSVYNSEQTSLRLEGHWRPGAGKWENIFGISSNQANMSYVPGIQPDDVGGALNGNTLKFDWQSNYSANKHHLLTLGAETARETGKLNELFYGSPYIIPEHTKAMSGYYAQDQITLQSNWFATVGLRLDDYATFGSQTTYRVASTYRLFDNGPRLKATYGTGFNAPSLDQLYDPYYGNTNLQPEKSSSWDAGAEQEFFHGKTAISATYFHNDYENLIQYMVTNYQNVAKATAHGIELVTSFRPSRELHFDLNYTYLSTKGQDGIALPRRPSQQYGATVTFQCTPKLTVNLQGTLVGKRLDEEWNLSATPPTPPVTLPSYTLINLSATYNVTSSINAFARLDNAFNAHYQEVATYATPGRVLSGGMSYKF